MDFQLQVFTHQKELIISVRPTPRKSYAIVLPTFKFISVDHTRSHVIEGNKIVGPTSGIEIE